MTLLADAPCYTILLSKDLDASRTFYRDVLGLDILREDLGPGVEERIVFRTANGRLILSKSTVGTSDTQTQMAWIVPDIHAALDDLRARGVKIEEYEAPDPVTVEGVADLGYSWAAWFIDPSRNCLAIVQPKD
jgi:catechol 2,3-dioxygenase-like lactoylglutathione lyase family enzyme